MKSIIVPVDFSATSYEAANYAQQLAHQTGAKLTLLHAFLSPSLMPADSTLELTEEGLWKKHLEMLGLLAEKMEKKDPTIKIEYIQLRGTVTESVRQLSESIQSQMVVIGMHGASGLSRTIIGSNALQVALQTSIPVLIIPPGAVYSTVKDLGLATDFREVEKRVPEKKIEDLIALLGARLHILHVDFENRKWNAEVPLQSGLLETMFQEYHPSYHFIEDPNVTEGLTSFAENNSIEWLMAVKSKEGWMERLIRQHHLKDLVFNSKIPLLVLTAD